MTLEWADKSMNKKTFFSFGKLFTILVIGVSLYVLGLAYINSHELIHRQIYARYGIETRTTIDFKTLSGMTIPEGNLFKCNDFCKFSNSLNDIVSYSLVVFIMNSWMILLAYFLLMKYGINKTN